VWDAVLLRDLPYESPDELVTVWLDMSRLDGPVREWFTPVDLADYRAEPGLFAELAGWGGWRPTLTGIRDPEVIQGARVTDGMFQGVLGVQPVLGRTFSPDEDEPGAAATVLLSHSFWQDRLGGAGDVLGRSILLNEEPFTVVGVMPPGFQAPFVPDAEIWTTARLDPAQCGRGCFVIRSVARMAPGLSLEMARERASAIALRLEEAYPDTNTGRGAAVFGLQEDLVGQAAQALWVLLGAVGFVLLLACKNVANLLLARGAAREREFAVRVALGAGRGPILRQLLTESLILAGLGGLAGLMLASWGTDALISLAPMDVPGLAEVGLDGRILAFTAAVTVGTGVLFGLFPAVRAARDNVYASVRGAKVRPRAATHLRRGLVVTQVGMALVLLVGAGLLTRSFQRLNSAELGFDPDGVLAVTLNLPVSRFDGGPERTAFYHTLLERLRALPGVISAGGTNSIPLAGNDGDADFRLEGEPPPGPGEPQAAWIRRVTGGYFYTVGLDLLEGREFDPGDDAQADRVIIINETLARRYFDYPRRDPVGSRITFGGGEPVWRTVVGVAGDTRHFGIRDGTRPAIYLPYEQVPSTGMTMVLRTDGEPLDLAADARGAVSSVDPALAASTIAPLGDLVDAALAPDRFVTGMLATFALLALLLAAVGLYGVISYGVTQRLREMGIRLALGAGADDMIRLVLRSALGMTALGVLLGLAGAFALTRDLASLLYGISVTDPVTFVTVVVVLGGVAFAASWLPARRARGADPVSVLRHD
jgi:predicted permease